MSPRYLAELQRVFAKSVEQVPRLAEGLLRRARADYERLPRRPWFFFGCFVLLCAILLIFWPLPVDPVSERSSLVLLSSEGAPLREFAERESATYQRWRPLDEYPPELVVLLLHAEDRRFYYHPGVDPISITRAALENIKAGRIVQGGSTITQQLVRKVMQRHMPRNAWARKIVETYYALKVELFFSKREILTAYLNSAPLRNNRRGFAAGARASLGRDVDFLSREELAALVVLVRASHTDRERLLGRLRQLLQTAPGNHPLPREDTLDAIVNEVYNNRHVSHGIASGNHGPVVGAIDTAPHFTEWLREEFPGLSGTVQTTISQNLNQTVATIIDHEILATEDDGGTNAAAVVLELDDTSGERRLLVRALVGSRNFFDRSVGQVNGALARRNAGSSLKPFVYALAMDRLGLRPYDIVNDRDLTIPLPGGEAYRPRNYDLRFLGEMRVSEALATSRNIPAVELTHRLGTQEVFDMLRTAGIADESQEADEYGPGVALGTSGARLFDLTRAYSALANDGVLLPVELGHANGSPILIGDRAELFSESASIRITRILSGRDERRRTFGGRSFLDFPYPVAAKTGTSRDYQDAWTVGYTPRYIVGVWVGRFSGGPMQQITGAWGAGRIFHQIVRLLHEREAVPEFQVPEDWSYTRICRATGKRATVNCPSMIEAIPPAEDLPHVCPLHPGPLAEVGNLPARADSTSSSTDGYADEYATLDLEPAIESPVSEEIYFIDPHTPRDAQAVPLRFRITAEYENRVTYSINGSARVTAKREQAIGLDRGQHTLQLFVDGREIDRVDFELR